MTTPDKEEMAAKHGNAAVRLDDIPQLIAAEPEIAVGLTFFVNHWGLDGYSPPNGVRESVRGIITLALNAARAALSTLPVNDRHHSGSDNERNFEKRRARLTNEWHSISTHPKGDRLFLAYCPPDPSFPDGRIMIWTGEMFARQNERTPDHLRFPATHWRPLPEPPRKSRVSA